MNRNDIQRMLSLTDEKYLDEILDGGIKITPRKRGYSLIGISAAAVIAFAAAWTFAFGAPDGGTEELSRYNEETSASGGFYSAADEFSRIPAETFHTGTEEPADGFAETASDVTSIFHSGAQDDDHSVYFRENGVYIGSERSEQFLSAFSALYSYNDEYSRKLLPFDSSAFDRVQADIIYDENGVPARGSLALVTGEGVDGVFGVNGDPMANIKFSADGEFYSCYRLEDPVMRGGAELYGFQVPAAFEGRYLYLYFKSGGIAYSCFFSYLDYDEAIRIADGLIEKGISARGFDSAEAERYLLRKEEKITSAQEKSNAGMTLERANRETVFAGFVPDLYGVTSMDMGGGVLKLDREKSEYIKYFTEGEPESLNLTYLPEDDGESFYICLNYTSPCAADDSGIPRIALDELDYGVIDSFASPSGESGRDHYDLIITNGDKWALKVNACCGKSELWSLLLPVQIEVPEEAPKPKEVTSIAGAAQTLTLDDVRRLAEKGEELTWSDFDGYEYIDTGSGLYIRQYVIKEYNYTLSIGGGSLDEIPMYVYLYSSKDDSFIDIRTGDIEEFLGTS